MEKSSWAWKRGACVKRIVSERSFPLWSARSSGFVAVCGCSRGGPKSYEISGPTPESSCLRSHSQRRGGSGRFCPAQNRCASRHVTRDRCKCISSLFIRNVHLRNESHSHLPSLMLPRLVWTHLCVDIYTSILADSSL